MEVILVSDLSVTAMDGTLKAWSSLARHYIDKLLEGDGGRGGGISVRMFQKGVNLLIRYCLFELWLG